MLALRAIGSGRTIERNLCLGTSLWLAACSADMTPSTAASMTRDPQTVADAQMAVDDLSDGGMVTRGAGMPIVPIHRADAGAKRDASVPVGNAPPPLSQTDAGVVTALPAPQLDAGQAAPEPPPDAGSSLPPRAAGPLPAPIRRYSFSGAGSNAPDLAGGSDAIVRGNALLDGMGGVSFPGQGDGFVELPSNLLDDATSFTVLVWLSPRSDACWQRALDLLHSQPSNAGTPVITSLFLSPYGCPDRLPTLGYVAGEAKFHLYGESALLLQGDGLVQLGASYSARSQTLRLIVNGVVQNEQDVPVDVRTLQRARSVLGRSDFGDPQLNGTITEVRVYASRLEPEELAEVYARGPDAL